MFRLLYTIYPLVAGKMSSLSGQDAIIGSFKGIRQGVLGISDSFVSLALALAAFFVGIKLIRLSYDTMSDEQGSGLGGVKLSQILGPVVIIALIAGYKYFIGALDYTVGLVVDNIADTSELSNAIESNAHEITLKMDEIDESIMKDALKLTSKVDSTLSWNNSAWEAGVSNAIYAYEKERGSMDSDTYKALEKLLTQYAKAKAKSNKESSGRHGTVTAIVGLLFNTVFLITIALANLFLCIFALLGPFSLAMSLFEPWKNAFLNFIGKYIEVSFWMVIAVIINWITTAAACKCTESAMTTYAGQIADLLSDGAGAVEAYYRFGKCLTAINLIRIAGLVALFSVPDIASSILSIGGGSAMGGAGAAAAGAARTAAGAPGKALGGTGKMILHKKGF